MPGKFCKSCGRGPLLEQFSCLGCPPQSTEASYDLCFECSWNCAREAHTSKWGGDHAFQLFRLRRLCDHCDQEIKTDFLMCTACRQDGGCYDLCLTCVLGRDGVERHKAMTSHEHVFRQVLISTSIPAKSAQPFDTHERWWCNICGQELTAAFFHCQGCGTGSSGFDMCISCADQGGLFRHGVAPIHQFLHVTPTFTPPPNPPQAFPASPGGFVHTNKPPMYDHMPPGNSGYYESM